LFIIQQVLEEVDSLSCQGWQVSANISLNQLKLVWQKQLYASFCQCNLHHIIHWQNWSFVIVCFTETLLLTNIKDE